METVDEIIFRTTVLRIRNRITLEHMPEGSMRIGEVLDLTPKGISDRRLTVRNPKSGKDEEIGFVSRKAAERLRANITEKWSGRAGVYSRSPMPPQR
jgi:site-specific recombinase XerD